MKRYAPLLALTLVFASTARADDTTTDNGDHHQTLKGAAAGAAVGHVAGHHAVAGAIIGGTAGAIKKHHDKKVAKRKAQEAAKGTH